MLKIDYDKKFGIFLSPIMKSCVETINKLDNGITFTQKFIKNRIKLYSHQSNRSLSNFYTKCLNMLVQDGFLIKINTKSLIKYKKLKKIKYTENKKQVKIL